MHGSGGLALCTEYMKRYPTSCKQVQFTSARLHGLLTEAGGAKDTELEHVNEDEELQEDHCLARTCMNGAVSAPFMVRTQCNCQCALCRPCQRQEHATPEDGTAELPDLGKDAQDKPCVLEASQGPEEPHIDCAPAGVDKADEAFQPARGVGAGFGSIPEQCCLCFYKCR